MLVLLPFGLEHLLLSFGNSKNLVVVKSDISSINLDNSVARLLGSIDEVVRKWVKPRAQREEFTRVVKIAYLAP